MILPKPRVRRESERKELVLWTAKTELRACRGIEASERGRNYRRWSNCYIYIYKFQRSANSLWLGAIFVYVTSYSTSLLWDIACRGGHTFAGEKDQTTVTASEGEGILVKQTGTNFFPERHELTLRFSINILRSLNNVPEREVTYFSHFSGFKSYGRFKMLLEFVLPHSDRPYVVSLDSKGPKLMYIGGNFLFDSSSETLQSSSESNNKEVSCHYQQKEILECRRWISSNIS